MTAQARLLGGRYQVGELLGYGGMAEVHRGRDLRLGRDVAIKMLRADLARDATFQMRFRREAQNAASLNHPAIVAVYDTGEETAPTGETLPFIVMEFVNGRTLKEVLGVEGRLQPRRALEICADMCAALEFSHRHGIIHRDIKPGNVMLTQTGQVKVMDFGIARALASGATTMTQTSAVIGTAQYLSPEQARGEAVDARSDVYAAGCVLFELLCGHPPFVGDSPVSVAYQHVREQPPTPSTINPDVNPAVDAIVLKALSKNPLNRYQSAGEMRADLLRAAAGRPVLATPVMPAEETMPMGAAAGGYHQAQQTQMMGPQTRQQPVARVGDPGKRKSSSWVIAAFATLGVLAVIALGTALWLNQAGNEKVSVPQLVDRTQADAQAALSQAGLRFAPGDPVKNAECKKGTVVEQNPPFGQRVEKNSAVTVQICAGPDDVTIPQALKGGTFTSVKATLEGLGLTVVRKDVTDSAPKEQVVNVSPDEGSTVAPNTKVTLEVSKGNVAEVPDVRGFTEDQARKQLENAGYRVKVVDGEEVEPAQVGKVSGQSPSPNRKLAKGETVTIEVDVPREEEPTSPTPSGSPSTSPSTPGNGGGNGGGSGFPFPPVAPTRTDR
ncbi:MULTISPECIES: Stk1 family PASTA domain-containing Ser/Thr kinase [Micromonospora]|uniref:non-specific serine/threonine protein kinase n=1 Tax=Micromonospora aurantiaca (nom. illeg.) TaxID=47850 RepID=A0A1C6TD07_9ACTN|nr:MULTISPECIES: Stk1 family PASTA domain-containing Ser/Thr kinase [Micromonospora]AXH89951.1 Stk1 family PASTA domain-containing Ser/Thr kinase [Micromonospora aurantiaca]MBC9006922.1 Stk1 family PASTA domain-containing Ser/Thr kinase [Micromonospora aurantiaca]OHX04935.1 serine/threonine protein kinase [Micromonospora sp. WMMB235]SCL39345.1 serine/threonine protein kinase [Micromonospora aurantiaca]